jgi:Ser/Thr protein kinase RdoA (MazF antagonist)
MDRTTGSAIANLAAKPLGLTIDETNPYSGRHVILAASRPGLQAVIKIGAPEDANQMRHEVLVAESFADRGISVARPLGELQLVTPTGSEAGYPVSLWYWEPGSSLPPDEASLVHLGRQLRLIHDCQFTDPPSAYRASFHDAVIVFWRQLAQRILSDPSHPWHDQPSLLGWFGEQVSQISAQTEAMLYGTGPLYWGHCDLHPGNVLFANGRSVLLDFEMATATRFSRDPGMIASWPFGSTFNLEQTRPVAAGYGTIDLSEILPLGPERQLTLVLSKVVRVFEGRVSAAELADTVATMRRHPEGHPQWLDNVHLLFT